MSVGSLEVYLARRKHQENSNYKKVLERDKRLCVRRHACMCMNVLDRGFLTSNLMSRIA